MTSIQPAVMGTFHLPNVFGGVTYTAGREHVAPVLSLMVASRLPIAIDIETFGLGAAARRLKCVSFAVGRDAVVLDPRDPVQADHIRSAIANAKELVFHNSAFDVPNLILNNLMTVSDIAKVTDTLIYARLADPDERSSKSLLAAAKKYLGLVGGRSIEDAFKMLDIKKTDGYRLFDLDRPAYLQGAAMDVLVTVSLLPAVREAALRQITEGHPFSVNGVTGDAAWELREREQVINRMLLRRSARGLRVDFDFLENYRQSTQAELWRAEQELEKVGIVPGNGNSLTGFLDAGGHLPGNYPRTPKTGKPSATAKNLESLDHPLAQTFVSHKRITKILDDYLTKVADLALERDGHSYVHPTTQVLAATTGRASMGDPPLHQFPGPARGIILADPGDQWVSIDWSQIEPVVAANIAGDKAVLSGYEDGSSDLYTEIAKVAGVPRKTAKVIVLAQMYGEGMKKLSEDLGIDIDSAYALKDAVFGAMPRVATLIKKLRGIGERYQCIFTMSGRIVPIPMSKWDGRESVAVHKAVNYFVQGSAYDVLAESLVRVEEAGLGDAVYLTMHDELGVSKDAAHDIERIMQTPPERLVMLSGRTPVLRTDMAVLGDRWGDA